MYNGALQMERENNFMTQQMAKICVATSAHYAFDTRIYFKQIRSLSKRFVVDYYAPKCSDGAPKPSGNFIALPTSKSKFGRLKIVHNLFKLLKASNYNIYHFHDPELWLFGLFLKWKKKNVIIDIHEHFSKQVLDKEWIPVILRKVLSFFIAKVEKRLPKIVDYLIIAEDSYLSKYNNICNISVIHNFPYKQHNYKSVYNYDIFKMVYVGDIRKVRGIIEYLKLLKLGKDNNLNIKLVLIGPFASSSLKIEYEEYIRENNLKRDIIYHGRLLNKDVYDILKKCDLGLALLHPIPNYVSSYPTKVFEYMSVGLPTLASEFELWDGVVKDYKCGFTVNPFDTEKAFRVVKEYYHDPKLMETHGQNGISLINRSLNWENEEKKVFKIFDSIVDCNVAAR